MKRSKPHVHAPVMGRRAVLSSGTVKIVHDRCRCDLHRVTTSDQAAPNFVSTGWRPLDEVAADIRKLLDIDAEGAKA